MDVIAPSPGPWTYDYAPVSSGDTGEFMVMTPDLGIVAHAWEDKEKNITGGTVEANARLIAAAPELLAAAQMLSEWADGITHGSISAVVYAANLAINKATGQAS